MTHEFLYNHDICLSVLFEKENIWPVSRLRLCRQVSDLKHGPVEDILCDLFSMRKKEDKENESQCCLVF